MTKPTSSPDPKNGAPLQKQTCRMLFAIALGNNDEMRRHVKEAKRTAHVLSRHPPPLALIQFCCTRKSLVPICMFAVDPFVVV